MRSCHPVVRRPFRLAMLASASTLACALASLPAMGQNFELVPSTAGAAQTGQLNSLTQTAGRTYQFMISSAELAQIQPGWEIVGLQFRLDEAATGPWPPAPAVFTDFEIRVAASNNAASTFSTTFSNNPAADNTLVRDGALTWATNSWPGGAAVNGFGPIIAFTTPYRYAGTDVVFSIRHTGQTGAPVAFLDATPQGVAPVGSTVNAAVATSATPLTPGTLTSFCAVRVIYRPVPVSNSVVVPPTYAVELGGVGQFLLGNIGATTFMMIMSSDQFAGMPPGSTITGVQFRNSAADTTVPAAPLLVPGLRLEMASTNSTPAVNSDTIASNMLADFRVLYADSPVIAAGAFPVASGGVYAFGPEFPFANGFTYKGGNLAMVLRRDAGAINMRTDAVFSSVPNFGERFTARRTAGDANATTITSGNTGFPVMKFNFQPATVVPNGAARNETNASISTPITNVPTTSQMVIAADQLRHIPVGSLIEGMSFRLDGGAVAFPAGGDAVYLDFTVRVSSATRTPATMSTVVAENEGADLVIARTGPMVVRVGSYTAGPPVGFPNAYGPTIRFDQPFVYRGGPLCITVRHGGHNRGFNFVDAAATGDPAYGTAFRHRVAGGDANALTVPSQFNMPVLRLHFTSGGYSPVARASVEGNSSNNTPLRNSPFTIQAVVAQSELEANDIRPGALITSLGFRLKDTRPSFPFQGPMTFSRYDVSMSTAARTPATWSTTFATNEGSDAVLVRDGPLSIRELLLQGDGDSGDVNRATWRMNFTRPFLYRGGPLCITIRHDGSNISSVMEVDTVSGAAGGVGTAIAGGFASGSAATVATGFSVPIPLLSATNLTPACLADIVSIGGSPSPDGLLTGDDFNAFIAGFASESLLADVCGVGGLPALPDGLLTGDDFNAFIAAFAAGCP